MAQIEESKEVEKQNLAYLPMDILINISELRYGKRVDRGGPAYDFFFPVTFRWKPCHIETPKLLYMFKLDKYMDPDGGKFSKFSISLSLREICREAENGHNVTNFKYLLENMDLFAMQGNFNDPRFKYCSSILPSKKDLHKPPILRVKVPSDGKRLKITIVKDDKELYYPLATEFEEIFKHRNEVRCILEVSNIWYAGGKQDSDPIKARPKKFGISYKLIKIQLADNGRRSLKFRPM